MDAAPKTRREKKEAFKIDFLAPSEKDVKEIAKELFAPPAKASSILLPGTSAAKKGTKGKKSKGRNKEKEDKRDTQTLPDDMHFSSQQLVTLFLKPKFSVRILWLFFVKRTLRKAHAAKDAWRRRTWRVG